LQVYKDNKGYPTVGLGHLVTAADSLGVGDTISLKRAQELLIISLSEIETRFNRDIWLPLYQFEYDALVSVAFNCGAFRGSNALIAQINSGEHGKMFDFLLSYRIGNNAKLKRRRFQEARLFETGIYDATH